MKKSSIKWIVTGVALFMALLLVLVLVGKATNGKFSDFKNASLRKVNEDNLYQSIEFKADDNAKNYIDGANPDDAFQIKFDDNKVLRISGEIDGEKNDRVSIDIGTVTLEAGKAYLFNSGLGSAGNTSKVYMQIVDANNTLSVTSGNSTVAISSAISERVVTIKLVFVNGSWNSLAVRPVLCAGTDTEKDLVPYFVSK